MEASCRKELDELHRFFAEWLTGGCEEDLGRCESALAKDFEIVWPAGNRMKRHELLDALKERYGIHDGRTFRISIENVSGRMVGEGIYLLSYEEWQQTDEGRRGRQSTALLRHRDDAPNGVEWVHVHETWLPG